MKRNCWSCGKEIKEEGFHACLGINILFAICVIIILIMFLVMFK